MTPEQLTEIVGVLERIDMKLDTLVADFEERQRAKRFADALQEKQRNDFQERRNADLLGGGW